MAHTPELRPDDPALGLLRVLREDGRTDPALDPFLPKETLVAMFRELCRVRAVDTALVALQREGRIGFHAACTGQEAVPVGAAFALEPSDWVFPALRESSILLHRGFPLERYVAHSFGSGKDLQKGRQSPGHPSARGLNVASVSTSIGTQLPHCVGVAWGQKKTGARAVAVGFVGDGGTSTPDFHSAMNFAGVFRVPCILVCQNNQVAISTPASRQTASVSFAVKARAYGFPGIRVDGADVLAVYRAVSEARVRAVAGAGPTFLECVTERSSAHLALELPELDVEPPPLDRDPLERFRRHLEYLGVVDAEMVEAMREGLDRDIRDAILVAEAEAKPPRDSLFDDVYAERPWHLAEEAAKPPPSEV